MSTAADRNYEAFRRALPGLLADPANRGRHALIHDEQIAGLFATDWEALDAGYDRFGLSPFLIQEVAEYIEPKYFSRNITPCPS